MKKFLKFGAVFAAMVLALAFFAGCKNDDDDGPSVVSTWVSEDDEVLTLYSDGTWAMSVKENGKSMTVAKGTYTKESDTLKVTMKQELNDDGKLVNCESPETFDATISNDGKTLNAGDYGTFTKK